MIYNDDENSTECDAEFYAFRLLISAVVIQLQFSKWLHYVKPEKEFSNS